MRTKLFAILVAAFTLLGTICSAQQAESVNPYAALGHTPYIAGAEKQSSNVFIIENFEEGSVVGRLEHNPQTGVVKLFDRDGNFVCDAQLNEEDRAFISRDPKAEKYYNISPYAYVANNPINAIDPTGEEISFSYEWEKDKKGNYVINEQRGRNLTGITMHVTGKVINVSSSSVNMDAATSAISSRIESAFKGEIGNGIAFNTVAHLSVANSMNDVSASDHVFALADMADYNGNTVPGASNQVYGKVAFIDADYFRGPWDRTIGNTGATTAAHELGHLTGLTHDGGGLMTQGAGNNWFIYKTTLSSNQLSAIYSNQHLLNQGSNSEIMYVPSPGAGGQIRKSMPNRGQVRSLVKYPYTSF